MVAPGPEVAVPSLLHVVAAAPIGGKERVVRTLAVAQHRRRGDSVAVLVLCDHDVAKGSLVTGLAAEGVLVSIHTRRGRDYRGSVRRIREAVADTGADVVHSHGYEADVLCSLALHGRDTHLVSTAHGFTGGGWKNRLYERLQVCSYHSFDRVIAVSGPLAKQLAARGVAENRIATIPNAGPPPAQLLSRRDARLKLGLPQDGWTCGWVGRLSREKGPDLLVEAVHLMGSNAPRVSMIGGGRMEEGLRSRIDTGNLPVRLHGILDEAAALLNAFDCLVLSSRTEGTPMTLLEAITAGLPVIATRVGGIPDVVTESEALLVDPESPQALADAIRDVRANPDAARARAANAANRLQAESDVAAWVDAYEKVYAQCAY